jgi:predicted N-formylglutamate amidohydrolase
VKEFLASGVNSDIESLQELLEETEGMPVAMVEADLLRSHIEALQWAEKARPILEKEKMKLSSLQRLSRDISK